MYFVDIKNPPENVYYELANGYCVQLLVKYFVKIFHFDHSTKSNTNLSSLKITNFTLDNFYCSQHGECNYFRNNLDWFTFVSFLYIETKNDILKELIDTSKLQRTFPTNGSNKTNQMSRIVSACICKDPNCASCEPIDPFIKIDPLKFIINTTLHVNKTKLVPLYERPTVY